LEFINTIVIPIRIANRITNTLGVLSLFLRTTFPKKLTIPNKTTARNCNDSVFVIVLLNEVLSKRRVGKNSVTLGNAFSVSNRYDVKRIATAKIPQKGIIVFLI
jgi:hypothetical protein